MDLLKIINLLIKGFRCLFILKLLVDFYLEKEQCKIDIRYK